MAIPMTKVLLAYNAVAGNGMFAQNLDYIIQKFQAKGKIVIPFRTGNKEALHGLFANLEQYQFSKIIVAGGDGTINTIVNLMMKYDVKIPLAIYPAGTANDFATYFGVPFDMPGMVKVSLSDKTEPADLGCANGRYFVNVCGFGFPVEVGQKTDQHFKNAVGVLSYYLKGIEQLQHFKAYRMKVQSEECSFDENIFFMVVMNGRSAGGFKKLALDASIQDGLLDVIVFKECNVLELMPLLVQLVRGEHTESPHVIRFKTSRLMVECDPDMATDVDGEPGPKEKIEIVAAASVLQVIVSEVKNENRGNRWKRIQ